MESSAAAMSAGKAYHFLCSAVAPRPIAWVTTLGPDGIVNAAPFSWFQAICADPPMLMVAIVDKPGGVLKDTARNARDLGEFVVNIARGDQLADVVATSVDLGRDESEPEHLDIATTASQAVAPPRILGCAAHLECRVVDIHRYGRDAATSVLIGEVVHVAADDDLLDGRGNLDAVKAGLPARLGGQSYLRCTDVFEVERPFD